MSAGAVIDERVVQLKFDNNEFEQHAKTSMNTVEKLKQSLNFKSTNKELLSLNDSAKKINFTPISTGIESVKMEFSALQVAAMTVMSNITNSVINTGKNLVYKFNIEPITSGLQEYETQINAVQTIMANTQDKGTTLDQVNAALDELNHYADMTIYNFTQMTRNIGTFTAAGVDLETSVNAIQGIANLAAVSGSTSQQASVAMYQLSQALATGTVKLQDWNSVVNAGMGGQVFQNALKRTATVMGEDVDALIEKYGSFRESLSRGGWLTTEVLTETLGQFAGAYDKATLLSKGYSEEQTEQILQMAKTATDAATKVKTFTQLMDTLGEAAQSGWTETWELIIGDFDQAKTMWTGVSDVLQEVIGNSADARNKLVSNVMQSNWDKFEEALESTKISLDDLTEKVRIAASESGYENLDELIEKYGTLGAVFEHGALSSDILQKALMKLPSGFSSLDSVTSGLQLGSTGDDVSKVQEALVKLGYTLEQYGVDGKIGSETVAAIKAFQEAKGIDITGIVDDQTLNALREASGLVGGVSNNLLLLARNVDELGGRDLLLQSFSNIWKGLVQVTDAVKAGWKDVFPESTASRAERILGIIKSFNSFSKGMKLSTEDSERLRKSFSGLFSVVKLLSDIFNGGLKAGGTFVKALFGDINIDAISVIEHIGSMVQGFTDWIRQTTLAKDAVTKLTPAIQNGVEKFKDWGKELDIVDDAKDFFENIKESLSEIKNMDTASIGDKIGVIKNNLLELGGNHLAAITQGMFSFGSVMKSTFLEIPEFVDGGFNKIKEFIEYVESIGGVTKDNIGQVLNKFNETIGSYVKNAGDIFVEFTDAIGSVKEKASGYVDSLLGVGDKLKQFFTSIAEYADDHKVGQKLANGAIVIGVFALSAKLLQAVKNITKIGVKITDFLTDFANAELSEKKAKASTEKHKKYLLMASSLLLVAVALKTLSTIPWDQMKVALTGMGIAMAEFASVILAMELIGKFVGTSATVKSSLAIVGLVSSVLLIVGALKAMETLDINSQLYEKLIVIGVILTGLVAVIALMNKIGSFSGTGLKAASTILSLAVATIIIVKALKELNGMMTDINSLIISCTLLAGLMITLGVVAAAMGKISFSGGMGILVTVTSIKILINILREITELDLSGLKDHVYELSAVFGALIVLMAATRLAGKNAASGGVGILAMSASIYLLIGAIKLLGSMGSATLNKGVSAVTQLLLIMGVVTALSNFAGKNAIRAGAQILLMATAISAIALVIVLLAGIDPSSLYRATDAVVKIIAVFGAFMMIMNLSTSAKNIKMGPLLAMVAIIGMITGSIALLASMDSNSVTTATDALTSVSSVFAALVMAIGFMNVLSPNLTTTIASMTGTLALFGAVAGIIALLATFTDVDKCVSISDSLAGLMKSIALFTGAAGLLGLGAGGLASLAKAVTILAAVGLVVTAVSELSSLIDGGAANEWIFSKLESFFEGVGKLIGHIANGIVGVLSDDVKGIGNGLSTMITNLKPFCEEAKSVDDSTVTGVENLAKAMMALTKQSILDRIASLGDDQTSIERFASNLTVFAGALIDFNDTVSSTTFNNDKIDQATEAGRKIAEMAQAIPASGGVLQGIIGMHDLDKFSSNLSGFGEGIVAFINSVSNATFNTDSITKATEAGKAIAEMSNSIPESGGFLQKLMGSHDLGDFATNLSEFGTGIVSFVNALGGANFESDNVTTAMSVIQRLANVNETITHSNEFSLQSFTETLQNIPKYLTVFIAAIQEIDIGSAEIKIASILGLFRTLSGAFDGDVINTDTISESLGQITDGIKNVFTELSTDSSIGVSAKSILMTFAEGITANEDVITDALYNAITAAVGKASVNATNDTNVQTSANKLAQNLANAMQQESTAGMASAGNDQASAALSGITSKADEFASAGSTLVSSLNQGISSKQGLIRTTMVNAVRMALAGVRSYENAAYNSGYNFGSGYYNGMGRWISPIANRAAEMVRNAIRAANKEQQSASPAKKLIRVGRWFAQGYANGIKQDSYLAMQASSGMVDGAIKNVQGTISTMGSILSSDLDNINPTISPVVDMSNVTRSAGIINDMLSFNNSIGVMTDLRSINTTMNQSRQNGGNSDIISELRKLRSTMENIPSGNTTNINGVTYDSGSAVSDAVGTLIRAIVMEGRI